MKSPWQNYLFFFKKKKKKEVPIYSSFEPLSNLIGKKILLSFGLIFLRLGHRKLEEEINQHKNLKLKKWGFPGGAVVENLPANAGDTGSSPGLGRSHMPRSNLGP